jgi:putative endonuclease
LWYVYFLELSNGDIYIGSTNDLRRWFTSHQNGYVVSTREHLPAALRSYVAVADEATARSLERFWQSLREEAPVGNGRIYRLHMMSNALLKQRHGPLIAHVTDRGHQLRRCRNRRDVAGSFATPIAGSVALPRGGEPIRDSRTDQMLQAFSSEVDTGPREENASNKNPGGAPVISHDCTGLPAKQIRSAMAAPSRSG